MVNVLSDKHQLQNLRSAQSTAVPKYELTDDGLRVLVFFFFCTHLLYTGKKSEAYYLFRSLWTRRKNLYLKALACYAL